MERKVKYGYDFKLRCVNEVLKKHQAITVVAKENGIGKTGLKDWISRYLEFGNEGLLPIQKNKNYSAEFKLAVLKTIINKSLSLNKACLLFNIPSSSIIRRWQIRYTEEGLTGLKPKVKGRPIVMNFKRKQRKTDKPLTREEELLKELEYLRAENEILKKFNALVQAEQANQNKRLKP
ncbi:transposase [Flavobacterium sp. DGU99]|uniref:Transposase n=1 Tax=Flavobacterium flavipallidum TaxID=3139140 RepID=A0ABU9HRS7_9FLAO